MFDILNSDILNIIFNYSLMVFPTILIVELLSLLYVKGKE